MTSGAAQGSVLGPIPFLVYMNDVPSYVDCSFELFANDTLMYQPVSTTDNEARFQKNFESLCEWALISKMHFNASKYQIVPFNPHRPIPEYTMNQKLSGTQIISSILERPCKQT